CVFATKPSGARHAPSIFFQPSGMKSQAVFPLGWGIPGVSGEEKVRAPPICGGRAKEPGVVPVAGLAGIPTGIGREWRDRSAMGLPLGVESIGQISTRTGR